MKLGEFGAAVSDFDPVDIPASPAADPETSAHSDGSSSIAAGVGVIRVGKKILTDGAWSLARHTTYGAALGGLRLSGVSVGVSHGTNDPADALAATLEVLVETPAAAGWALSGGKGVSAEALGVIGERWPAPAPKDLDRWGAVATAAALSAAHGDTAGATFRAPDNPSSAVAALVDQLVAAGLSPAEGNAADVLIVDGVASSFDHHAVSGLKARVVLPVGINVVSPRALADATRASIVVVPDFVAAAGQLIGRFAPALGIVADDEHALAAAISTTISDRLATPSTGAEEHPEGSFYLDACRRAEDFITTWQPALPAARPIG